MSPVSLQYILSDHDYYVNFEYRTNIEMPGFGGLNVEERWEFPAAFDSLVACRAPRAVATDLGACYRIVRGEGSEV